MSEVKFIQQIEIKVVLKREGRKQFHRRGVGKDLISALQYLQKTQTGVKIGMYQEVCSNVVQAADYIKEGKRNRSSTRKARRDKVIEVIGDGGQVAGYKRNGKLLNEAQIEEWLKQED